MKLKGEVSPSGHFLGEIVKVNLKGYWRGLFRSSIFRLVHYYHPLKSYR